jgi:D-threo-aldose 1-dehydrogenase
MAAATLAAAWAAGIRAFDTAPHYGVGVSERRLGSFLAGYPRDEFTVSTKVGRLLVPAAGDVQGEDGFYGIPPLTRVRDYSRDGVRRSLAESLERLGLDRVDIALIHDPDDFMKQAADEAYPARASLRDSGVVRAIGAGMNSASALAWLAERCDLDCVLVAGRYTLLDQAAATELFPVCQRRGVAVLAAGVFNSGILAGPVDGGSYDYAPAPPAVLARARLMRDACARHGGFYLGSIGGPAARLAQDCIKKVEVLEYPELGMEAIWRIEVEDFTAFIVVDDKGNDFFKELNLG